MIFFMIFKIWNEIEIHYNNIPNIFSSYNKQTEHFNPMGKITLFKHRTTWDKPKNKIQRKTLWNSSILCSIIEYVMYFKIHHLCKINLKYFHKKNFNLSQIKGTKMCGCPLNLIWQVLLSVTTSTRPLWIPDIHKTISCKGLR